MPEETQEEFEKTTDYRELLRRWVNFHLKAANLGREINNLDSDLQDGVVLSTLLNQLDSGKCEAQSPELSQADRLERLINESHSFGIPKMFRPSDIELPNPLFTVLLCAELFLKTNGLEPPQPCNVEERKAYANIINNKLKLDPDLAEVLPLNPENNSLFNALKDGIILKYFSHQNRRFKGFFLANW